MGGKEKEKKYRLEKEEIYVENSSSKKDGIWTVFWYKTYPN